MAIDKILGNGALDQVADSVFSAVSDSVSEIKAMQKRKAAENVQVVIQALKKIESDLQDKYDGVTTVLEKRVASIKDGKDGQNGVDGRAGKDGRPGRDGAVGPRGANGIDGRNGRDGVDGVSVVNANIDFDGSLIISLSNGRTINVGEVVAPDLAERIKVITNGGGTSQGVLDAIAALQATIATYGTMALQNASAVAITGGAINGTTIGAASASTGAFTTLTTSSTVTLNGGTANGVAYLNASKVLTTGSALTFDGTNLAVGTTTISNANTDVVTVGKNSGTYDASIVVRQFGTGTAAGLQLIAAGDAGAAYNSITSTTSGGTQHWKLGGVAGSAGTLPFSVSGSEQMRLTSTGLGIGTSSPGAKLHVGGNQILQNTSSSIANNSIRWQNSSGTYQAGIASYFNTADTGNIEFLNGGTTNMQLSSSGNLGLGVTPSAWTANFKAIDINGAQGGGAVFSASNVPFAGVMTNAYFSSGGAVYKQNGFAGYYLQNMQTPSGGSHAWFTAPSGTAGDAITFTQAMTLDASGNLLVGTTSTSSLAASGRGLIEVNGTSDSAFAMKANGTMYGYLYNSSSEFRVANVTANPVTFFTNNTERARITSGGDLGIGTSSPLDRLDVASANTTYRNRIRNTTANEATFLFQNSSSGTATNDGLYLGIVGSLDAYLWNYENNPIIFGTNNTERARITSGGYFKASFDGTYNSATGQFHEFVGNVANGYTVRTRCANASPANHYINEFIFSAASPNNTGALFIECRDSTAARFELRSNGGLANYSANDVNLSDRREKTNFAPAKSYLDTICAIPVQTFNYADQNMEDDPGLTLGVVAQDVQAVAPELVMESNWGTKDEPKMRLSIYQTDLQYALMKCIQEQQALIQTLTARVAALESI